MAVIQKDFNVMGLPMAISRNNPIPLDKTAIWYDLISLKNYAATDPTAYVGQILGLVDEINRTATAYIITSTSGTVKEVGVATVVDEQTIVLNNDSELSLYNFEKTFYKYVPATDAADAYYKKVNVGDIDPDTGVAYEWIPGLEPKVVLEDNEYVLGWYEPNPTTMEGVGASIAALQNAVNSINGDITALENKDSELSLGLFNANKQLLDHYTKAETNSEISKAIANADHLRREIIEDLPSIADAKANVIYMVPSGLQDDDNKYYEWMLIDGIFEQVGSWEVDLNGYAKTTDLDGKVDKQTGYGLVADTEIVKLGTIKANAEPNYVKSVGSEFNVDASGNLILQNIPADLDLSGNTTIQEMNVVVGNKVNKRSGYDLVETSLITKLENLPSDAEKNVINGVTTEFAIDADRTLSIVSVPATKITDLKDNTEFAEVLSDIISINTDIGELDAKLLSIQTTINGHGTSITTLSADFSALKNKVDGHDTDIKNILEILTWKELTE